MTQIISRDEAKARGLNKYFTGEPCVKGHIAERRTSYTMCVECDRVRQLDPELRAKVQAWRSVNKAHIKEIQTKYRKSDPEKWSVYWREYRKAKPDVVLARQARYRRKHPDKLKEAHRAYKKNNPEAVRAQVHRRRARKLSSFEVHTAQDIIEIRAMQRNKCAYCKTPLAKAQPHLDHIIPLAKGGSNGRQNLQILCRLCNMSKGAKHPIDFARKQGMLL